MRTNLLVPLYLTKSRRRAELLQVFLLNPESSFYLRELERKLGTSPGVLARELKAFSEDGFLKRTSRGKLVFYQVNSAHPFFSEIKGIIDKTAGISVRLRDGLQKVKEIKEAYLYGSFVKREMQAHSDIDLLLVGKETPVVEKLLKRLELSVGRTINATTYKTDEFKRKKEDKSNFLYEVMKSPTIQVKP
jgi:predicted nucleotidyltransferase